MILSFHDLRHVTNVLLNKLLSLQSLVWRFDQLCLFPFPLLCSSSFRYLAKSMAKALMLHMSLKKGSYTLMIVEPETQLC